MILNYKKIVHSSPLEKDAELSLIKKVKYPNSLSEKDEAYNQLLISHLPYIKSLISNYTDYLQTPEFEDDLLIVAIKIFYDSILNFDETKGYRLMTYATKCIKKQLVSEIENHDHHIRIPRYVYHEKSVIESAIKELSEILNREPEIIEIAEATGYSIKKIEFVFDVFKLSSTNSLDKINENNPNIVDAMYHDSDISEDIINTISMQNIVNEIKKLTTDQQFKIMMNYIETNSIVEVSKQMNLSVNDVRREINKTKRLLKKNNKFLNLTKEIRNN